MVDSNLDPLAESPQEKEIWPGGTMLYPLPVVLAGCGSLSRGDHNLITLAWTGIISSQPPQCSISVRPERHSWSLIKNYGSFTINLSSRDLAWATDWCGVKSGRDVNKWEAMNLTPLPARDSDTPILAEAPLSLECRVTDILERGSHHLFLADILWVHADKRFMDPQSSRFHLEKAHPICYCHGQYLELGRPLGSFGYSVMKPATRRRRKAEGTPHQARTPRPPAKK